MKRDAIIIIIFITLITFLSGCAGNKTSYEDKNAKITETIEQNRYVSIEELYRNAPNNFAEQKDWEQWENEYKGKYVKGKGKFDSVSINPQVGKLFFIVTIFGEEGTIENNPTQVALLVEDAHRISLGEKEGSFLIDGINWIYLGENYAFEGRVSEFSLFDTELVNSDYSDLIIVKVKMMDIRIVPAPSFVANPVTPPFPMQVATEAPLVVNNALLVEYDFESDFLNSGIIADRSGNAYDAQVNGNVAIVEGLSGGQAIFFSGDGYIQAQNNPAAGRSNVSFSLWFKTDQPDANYKLASAAWWNGGPGSGWILATHIPEFWSEDTQSLYFPGLSNEDNRFPIAEWVHEVVTYDGNHIREYTNGRLVNDWPTTGAALGKGQAMTIGAWPPFSAYNFQGSIDEFIVFGWALTPQEVQEIYFNQR